MWPTDIDRPPRTAPVIYYEQDTTYTLNWVAQGTDGDLYLVPAMPGGWLQRVKYGGDSTALTAVSPEKARSISWYVFGDVDGVAIAEDPVLPAVTARRGVPQVAT